jgi:hypothetical protein
MQVLALSALESDASGRVYLAASLVREEGEGNVIPAEQMVVFSPAGQEIGRVDLAPKALPEEQFRSIQVGADGAIVQLDCAEDGATLLRWRLSP